jgi:hypothetical protein
MGETERLGSMSSVAEDLVNAAEEAARARAEEMDRVIDANLGASFDIDSYQRGMLEAAAAAILSRLVDHFDGLDDRDCHPADTLRRLAGEVLGVSRG